MSFRISSEKNRFWELDTLRGFLMLGTLSINLLMTAEAFVIRGYYHVEAAKLLSVIDPLGVRFYIDENGITKTVKITKDVITYITYLGVDTYFVISGICCCFSRNNLKRALRLVAGGVLIAVVTKLYAILLNDPFQFNRFGALMCYAACQLITLYFFDKKSDKTVAIAAAVSFFIGYFLRYYGVPAMRFPVFYIFGVPQIGDMSSDYWPVFPMLGWFLSGVLIGRKMYSEKSPAQPGEKTARLTKPLRWLGRNSGIVYISTKLLYTAIFLAVGYLFHLL